MENRRVDEIIYRDDLYPRVKTDPTLVQKYAEDLDVLPPIEINQHNELIDGWHRWTAYKKREAETIPITITTTKSESHLLALAAERNAKFGWQLDDKSKRNVTIKLFNSGNGLSEVEIANIISVSVRTITNYLKDIKQKIEEERNETIFSMYMQCYTQEEIAEAVGLSQQAIADKVKVLPEMENFPNPVKLAATYQDDFDPKLYDIWNFGELSNETKHDGNTEVRIVDNLLYKYTKSFDIVIDPFAGGGSTLDICEKRLRRCLISDRKPIPERANEIRQHDVTTGILAPSRWQDVSLVYLDPPYWKQVSGKYSNDQTDLANMSLDEFNMQLTNTINQYAAKLKPESHIACIISPTQWPNEDKHTDYHDLHLIANVSKTLKLEHHIICPYSTQQYNGTQANIAKKDKLWLILSRRLIIWKKI